MANVVNQTGLIEIENLPSFDLINSEDIFEIITSDLGYFTHSFFKYPAKFIPQIPKWAIDNFSKPGDFVLDCFAGSGTTLVEASLNDRIALGVDFDDISRLLTKVKTTPLREGEIKKIRKIIEVIDLQKYHNRKMPDLKNLDHWFPEENKLILNGLYYLISELKVNQRIKDFLFVCYISIIRKCSYSDEQSPKPYIAKKHPKTPKKALPLFTSTVENYLEKINDKQFYLYSQAKFIGTDARNFESTQYLDSLQLVCASPPYINAFDYVRILRLENVWLRNLDNSSIIDHKKKQIGTEQIYAKEYNNLPPLIGISELDEKIKEVFKKDKKRAHIIYKYFLDMELNILNVYKYLKKDGKYVIVVGDCIIKDVKFPVYRYLIRIAEKSGYTDHFVFSYLIKNPYLRIPRKTKGGLIKYDRVIVLQK